MMYAPYQKDRDYDDFFPRLVNIANNRRDHDDDTLLFCTGLTGSGKTNLMFHFYELFDQENASMDYIGLKRENFADALKRAKNYKGKRFVGYDEGNVSKRDSLTKWNKAVIDLLFAIRGLNITQWWSNPSVNMLDKSLVQEKINGLIFVATKSDDKPRLYYYFTKQQVLDMLNKYDKLTIEILKDKGKQHCSYIGCFKKYKGRLLEEYLKIKENRMESKIDEFHEKWGSKDGTIKLLTVSDIAHKSNISSSTIRLRHDELVNNKLLIEGEHFIISPAGYRLYKDMAIDVFKESLKEKARKKVKKLVSFNNNLNKVDKDEPINNPYIDNLGGEKT